jgi:glycosyltransferase involved in cell wall biosynthesis
MNSPLISIIIPLFNREILIVETLDSVLNQTYNNWECIIVDDHSSDNSVDIVSKYIKSDNRFKFIIRDRLPKGAPTCRNIGLSNAQGEYIIFLDSDDILHQNCLSQRVSKYQDYPDFDFLVFKSFLFEEKITDAKYYWNLINDDDIISRFLKMDVLWQTSGPIYKKKYLERIGGFKEDMSFLQDFELHMRCLLQNPNYKLCFDMPADLYIRQGRKDTISRKTPFTSNLEVLQKRIDIYFEFLQNSKYSKTLEHYNYKKIIVSVIYFFSSQFYIKHGKYFIFRNNFNKAIVLSNIKYFSFNKFFIYILLIKINRKFNNLIIKSLINNYPFHDIPTYNVFATNMVGRYKI